MKIAWKVCAGLAAGLHVLFFLLESVLFTRPDVAARFKVAEMSDQLRVFAFNQGFYNLFLALGCAVGLGLASRKPVVGRTLVTFACACMFGAGLVLVGSAPELARAALVQALPPLGALIGLWLTREGAAVAAAAP